MFFSLDYLSVQFCCAVASPFVAESSSYQWLVVISFSRCKFGIFVNSEVGTLPSLIVGGLIDRGVGSSLEIPNLGGGNKLK